ncbi:restriction endonuclease subunit S [Shewanella glacialipiscicola]|uniref:restriction endonuclease subunit S n=1 Tax=Shewanella glacialipiscicola TaxID=614069 RepID=UPI0021DA9A28|nr:restriction endonuclease subunit S [Shewanella glacialipiscicola]MCU7995352.1 restriction endonuclease subunit S [Shewanella glacialipiscicola]MCU8025560.1 restriction endonuclease subunit S [Shewanella glacialipiscicola]
MSWPLVKLQDLVEINIGRTPSRAKPEYWGEGVSWLSIRDMNQGKLLSKTAEQITEFAVKETNCKIAKKGTVLFSFKLSIGKVGFAEIDMFHNEAIAAMPIKKNVELCEEYLYFALLQMDSSQSTDRAVMGATLNKKKMAELKIPLPPLETQKKIAAVLEKADQLRKDCQLLEQELNSLAQSVFIDMFGDPLINPKSWPVNRLGELTSKITDGKHGDCADQPNSGYFFVSAKNIRNGKIDYEGARQINKKEFDEVHKRTDLMPGDIVMINTGATIGRLAIADSDERTQRATFQKSVAVIKPIVRRLNPVFLKYVLMLRVTDFAALGSGSAIKNLLLSQMREFSIITPPLEKQNQFSLKEERINSLIKIINKNQDEAEISFNSLMQKAFKGELNL